MPEDIYQEFEGYLTEEPFAEMSIIIRKEL